MFLIPFQYDAFQNGRLVAVAEARAAWQRSANRCIVQEDAKRAPKLACQSSSASKPVDAEPANPADVSPTLGFMPAKRSPSSASLKPDLRWWLQTQPHYGHHRGLMNEQLSGLDFETELLKISGKHSSHVLNIAEPLRDESNLKGSIKSESSTNMPYATVLAMNFKKESDVKKKDLQTMYYEVSPELSGMSSYYEVMGASYSSSDGKQKSNDLGLDYESPWVGTQKAEPWWRTADGNELASLVVQCRSHLIKLTIVICLHHKTRVLVQKNLGILPSEHLLRIKKHSQGTVHADMQDTALQMSLADPSKAQLLEALCHSQTRAREAEKAVQQASIEKERIMKLFFRQASHLFAYRQWFKLLQLEAIYIQLKNKDRPLSSLFPAALSWPPQKSRKLKRCFEKGLRHKRSEPGHGFSLCTYGRAVALGLSLVVLLFIQVSISGKFLYKRFNTHVLQTQTKILAAFQVEIY
uniref:Uncharacterized protein n=1 Tax=Kalanchoe fedtschenkoi TaxID=63787 RepID=A0A7N1A3U9_KALFE